MGCDGVGYLCGVLLYFLALPLYGWGEEEAMAEKDEARPAKDALLPGCPYGSTCTASCGSRNYFFRVYACGHHYQPASPESDACDGAPPCGAWQSQQPLLPIQWTLSST